MITEITPQNIVTIKNRHLVNYAAIYLRIADRFAERVRETGLEFDTTDDRADIAARWQRLAHKGAVTWNDAKSIYLNRISPMCEACQTGRGSATFFLSLRCHPNKSRSRGSTFRM